MNKPISELYNMTELDGLYDPQTVFYKVEFQDRDPLQECVTYHCNDDKPTHIQTCTWFDYPRKDYSISFDPVVLGQIADTMCPALDLEDPKIVEYVTAFFGMFLSIVMNSYKISEGAAYLQTYHEQTQTYEIAYIPKNTDIDKSWKISIHNELMSAFMRELQALIRAVGEAAASFSLSDHIFDHMRECIIVRTP